MGHWGHVPPPPRLVTVSFLVYLVVTLRGEPTIQVLCIFARLDDADIENSDLSISTALVTKLLVIEQLLQPALKSTVSALPRDIISIFAPPRNKSWRRHWLCYGTTGLGLHCISYGNYRLTIRAAQCTAEMEPGQQY